jgi:arsenite methyltransferase
MTEQIHATVRDHYAAAARAVLDVPAATSCCDEGCGCSETGVQLVAGDSGRWGAERYSPIDLAELPEPAVLASLGCGNPTAVAELRAGETVLDLGSGGGIDVLLSAQRVGRTGRAIGVDMTDEMLELAERNAALAGAANVEFRKGTIEALPLDDATVDVVISNCVINLAADKAAVFSEIARVLRPGGRIGVTDVVADDRLTAAEREERGSFAGCIAGALSFGEYVAGLEAVGMTDIEIIATHVVADGMYGAIVRARRPGVGEASGSGAAPRVDTRLRASRELPVVDAGSCC